MYNNYQHLLYFSKSTNIQVLRPKSSIESVKVSCIVYSVKVVLSTDEYTYCADTLYHCISTTDVLLYTE